MISTSKRRLLQVALAVGSMLIAATAHSQGQPPIKIGMLFGFSGAAAGLVANFTIATRLAVKEINDAGGLLGRRVEIVQGDHGYDPARAVNEARRLLQQERVSFVLGPEASGLAAAVAPLFNEAEVVYFSTTGLTGPTPFNFSSVQSNVTQATSMVNFAADALKAKKVAIIADSAGTGKELIEIVRKLAPARGLEVVAVQEHEVRATDLLPQLLALRRANPDAILQAGSLPSDAGVIVKTLGELKWSPPVLSGSFGQATAQVMAVSGPDTFKGGNFWGFLPKAFTYCATDKVGDRAYDRYLAKLKAFDPAGFEKMEHKLGLFTYDPIFVFKAAAEGTKSLEGRAIVKWIEENGSKLRDAGAGYPLSLSASNRFIWGPNAVTFVQRPDVVRAEDRLAERKFDC